MNILITGATGMAGAEVVRQALRDPSVNQIILVIRRRSEFSDPRIREVIRRDFMNYDGLEKEFASSDACIWCLGISQNRVSRNQYVRVTKDYAVAAAKAMFAVNPDISFVFLSAEGADSRERSPVRFSRVKGRAENALINLEARRLFIFRPGGIVASNRNRREGLYKKFEILMVRIMGAIFPWSVISTASLAKAMLRVAREGYAKTIISHREITELNSRLNDRQADASSAG